MKGRRYKDSVVLTLQYLVGELDACVGVFVGLASVAHQGHLQHALNRDQHHQQRHA